VLVISGLSTEVAMRPKMVFAVYYLSTDVVSVNNFVC